MNKTQYAAVKALIDTPEKHLKGCFAKDKDGTELPTGRNPEAVKFCIIGACERVLNEEGFGAAAVRELHVAASELLASLVISTPLSGASPIVFVNDELDYAHVMKILDRAIELAPA